MNRQDPRTAAWNSSVSLGDIVTWLRARRRLVVLTHVKPDGDALGSTLAVTRAFNLAGARGWGGRATPWYFGPLPDWTPLIAKETPFVNIDEHGIPSGDEPDGVLILDTGSWSQLHDVEPWLRTRTAMTAVVDHHRQGDADVSQRRLVATEAAAACEPAAEICRALLEVPALRDLPLEVAEPLYLGLATDTGWFRHSNVTPGAMRTAAGLLECGVRHHDLYENIEQRDRPSRLRLMARALASLELLDHDRIAAMTLTLKDFEDCHASPTDSAGFVEIPLSVQSVQVSALITEAFRTEGPDKKHVTKISFRAKSGPGGVDVGAIAATLGGGGHVPAAGAKLMLPLAEAKRKVVEALTR